MSSIINSLHKKAIMLSIMSAIVLSSYCQSKNNFYDKQGMFAELKQSVSNAIDVYPRNTVVGAKNFKVLINSFDSVLFYSALDTLSKYDKGSFSNYYIIIVDLMGETAITKVFIRGYVKDRGKEVSYNLYPEDSKGNILVKEYAHNKRVFKDAYEMKIIEALPKSSDLLSISVFKNGSFKTKIYQANNLTPEYFEKINMLLGENR